MWRLLFNEDLNPLKILIRGRKKWIPINYRQLYKDFDISLQQLTGSLIKELKYIKVGPMI